jgi:Rod binding domain-containing protein
MLKSAHAAGGSTWSGDEEDPNSTLTEMGEQQMAQALASSGGVGLAKMVVAGLSKNADQSSESPQSATSLGAH